MATVNNDVYNHYGHGWYSINDSPVAILRMESKIKNEWISEQISKPPLKILDIACGAGFFCNHFAQLGHHVTGIDLSESTLETAKYFDQSKRVKYIHGDALNMPLKENQYDVVCLLDFLEHTSTPQKALSEAYRVLRPKGLLFYHTINRTPISWLLADKALNFYAKDFEKNIHRHELFITPHEMNKLLEKSSFKPLKEVGIRPKFNKAFFKTLLRAELDNDFKFLISKNKGISYMGMAIKN